MEKKSKVVLLLGIYCGTKHFLPLYCPIYKELKLRQICPTVRRSQFSHRKIFSFNPVFLTLNIILLGNFPEKISEKLIFPFLQVSSTVIGVVSIYSLKSGNPTEIERDRFFTSFVPLFWKIKFWPFFPSYIFADISIKNSQKIFGKNQIFMWLDISISIFITIACIIRKKRVKVHKLAPGIGLMYSLFTQQTCGQ